MVWWSLCSLIKIRIFTLLSKKCFGSFFRNSTKYLKCIQLKTFFIQQNLIESNINNCFYKKKNYTVLNCLVLLGGPRNNVINTQCWSKKSVPNPWCSTDSKAVLHSQSHSKAPTMSHCSLSQPHWEHESVLTASDLRLPVSSLKHTVLLSHKLARTPFTLLRLFSLLFFIFKIILIYNGTYHKYLFLSN